MLSTLQGLLLLVLPLGLVFFILSLLKTSLRSLPRVSLRRLADGSGSPLRELLERFLHDPSGFILHLQSLIQLSLIGIAVVTTMAMMLLPAKLPALTAFLCLGAAVLVFEHFFPRFVTSVNRERLLAWLLPAYRWVEPLAALLAWPVAGLYRAVFHEHPGRRHGAGVSDEEVRAFIDAGEEAGILDEGEGELIESVVDFGDTLVREVMTPRVDMIAIEADRKVTEIRELFIEHRHSRIPVYRERIDNIEGVVYQKDLLEAWRDGQEGDGVTRWMKLVSFVPETKKVSSLLKEFQRNRVSFAVVVDEFGSTVGLVTVEDLIEEIVGDIKEDHEEEPEHIRAQPDGSFLVSGKVHVYELEELFGLEISDADFETLAGLVFATLGRVPVAGEEFTYAGLRFQVVDADRRRVNQVQISPRSAPIGDVALSGEPG